MAVPRRAVKKMIGWWENPKIKLQNPKKFQNSKIQAASGRARLGKRARAPPL
jgi:hypothetical protein